LYKYLLNIIIVGVSVFVSIPFIGCDSAYTPPINDIKLFRVPPPQKVGIWPDVFPSESPVPFPIIVQQVFTPGEKMVLGLVINERLAEGVSFSKYTFFNRQTGEEREIESSTHLGPFRPGQIVELNWDDPWLVPAEPGTYMLRVYLDSRIVASAIFEVKDN